jgi:hypothetical protein
MTNIHLQIAQATQEPDDHPADRPAIPEIIGQGRRDKMLRGISLAVDEMRDVMAELNEQIDGDQAVIAGYQRAILGEEFGVAIHDRAQCPHESAGVTSVEEWISEVSSSVWSNAEVRIERLQRLDNQGAGPSRFDSSMDVEPFQASSPISSTGLTNTSDEE